MAPPTCQDMPVLSKSLALLIMEIACKYNSTESVLVLVLELELGIMDRASKTVVVLVLTVVLFTVPVLVPVISNYVRLLQL